MKAQAWMLALALVIAPLSAMADDTTAPPPGPPQLTQSQRDAMHAAMKSYMDQSTALHKETRSKVLGALTSAHRTLLASVVSQLAVASDPDPHKAIQTLDAALSSSEQQTILAASSSERTQEKALRENMRVKMQSIMPMPSPHPGGPGWDRHGEGAEHASHEPDAGAILLMSALGFHEHHMDGTNFMDGADRPQR